MVTDRSQTPASLIPSDWLPGIYPVSITETRIGRDGRRRVRLWGKWRRIIEQPGTCQQCGELFWAIEGDADRVVCGNACRDAARDARNADQTGDKNPYWKGGRSTDAMFYRRRAIERHPLKNEARRIARAAIDRGEIIPQPCEKCGDLEAQGHHPDYNEPLRLEWLCRKHHSAEHGGRGVGRAPKKPAIGQRRAA